MLLVWVLTAILQSIGLPLAVSLWAWFGLHPFVTIFLILILA